MSKGENCCRLKRKRNAGNDEDDYGERFVVSAVLFTSALLVRHYTTHLVASAQAPKSVQNVSSL